eukprot:TRINITY_DN2621_c1_g4_i1.p1 TRINITY_DN2621_c1_g4~~TRINITY_DN2621_c1_g4_i1.p1  ORF type:complete len:520 (+),score=209.35 TRINITY_DN2621_c1_g4_i1:51-1610(+)
MGGEAEAQSYLRNVTQLSVCFFFVFTAFSAIQNLEASVVGGHCDSCDYHCFSESEYCTDSHQDGDFGKDDAVCSWSIDGVKYCAKFGGECKSTCPNNDGGWDVNITLPNSTMVVPSFDQCGASSNVGSIAIGILYLTFTICCIGGPFLVDYWGSKWSIFTGFILFSAFCVANLLVAQSPSSVALQWALLVPCAALVGFAASFLWTAQGSYVTTNAQLYAKAHNMEEKAALGKFNGIFWMVFQLTQISGNLIASLLLNEAGWSNTALMLFYLCFAGVGTIGALFIKNVSMTAEAGDEEQEELKQVEEKKCVQSVIGMVSLWKDPRMLYLIPLIMYNGMEQGFIWGDFTSNWVKPSVGLENIGYVMAAFGATDALGSFILGKVSDITGRFPIMTLGALCQLTVIIILVIVDVGNCDKKYFILILSAFLWGIGDAVWNTQISSILGEVFTKEKDNAFSNLKLWQSLMTSVMFFLNFDASLLSQNLTLYLVLGLLIIGYSSYLCGHMTIGFRAEEERAPLINA